ncbi:MAG: YbaN family protein [Christensenellaceae bacterium]|jgi:uncharacterized membrane protein YbaN (DUF454 family)
MKSLVLTISGFAFLGLGAVGVALPVMPTTPFILLSAICFATGNKRLSAWISKSPVFGSFIENYREKRGVPKKTKIVSIAFLWTGLIISMLITQKTWLAILLLVVGACVTAHILLIKTKRKRPPEKAQLPESD